MFFLKLHGIAIFSPSDNDNNKDNGNYNNNITNIFSYLESQSVSSESHLKW